MTADEFAYVLCRLKIAIAQVAEVYRTDLKPHENDIGVLERIWQTLEEHRQEMAAAEQRAGSMPPPCAAPSFDQGESEMPARRVAFNMAPAMAAEVDRILAVTDLGSAPEVFRRALTLLRIHVDAARKNGCVYLWDPQHPSDKFRIVLPFQCQTRT